MLSGKVLPRAFTKMSRLWRGEEIAIMRLCVCVDACGEKAQTATNKETINIYIKKNISMELDIN